MFDITVDDLSFRMSFGSFPIRGAIAERIEGLREPYTTSQLRSLVSPGDEVLELGACYGYFTIILSHLVGETGRVISVDDRSDVLTVLDRNLQMNGGSKVESHNIISKRTSTAIQSGAFH